MYLFSLGFFFLGASHHKTHDKSKLHNYAPPIQFSPITTVDGNSLSLEGVGSIFQSNLSVDNVLYVHQLLFNLLSIQQLIDLGYYVNFFP